MSRQQHTKLRQLPDIGTVASELLRWGPDRSWHRYRVGKDARESCGDEQIIDTGNKTTADSAAMPVTGDPRRHLLQDAAEAIQK